MPPLSIGHYQLGRKIGEGGMGEVYVATDTKLGREVAIKIIPEIFARDPDRMGRFGREARVLASLNHPNIASIYGVEERALVMELVEGPTLAERLESGPIGGDEALPIIEQLVDALEYAHDKGIIHRDLKPANIKITPDQRVKILDFGLARALSPDSDIAGTSNPELSPTLTVGPQSSGVILGTAAYMAPEQARGRAVDRRADIWSFGVLLYEMLTGQRPFTGETVSDTLAAVLRHDPDTNAAPPQFRRLLKACLVRDARRRMRDIGDARLLLESPSAGQSAAARPRTLIRWAPWAVALAAIAMAVFGWRGVRHAGAPVLWLPMDLGPEAIRGRDITAVLSPDGKNMVIPVRTPDGRQRLALRALDDPNRSTVLAGTENAANPFFSPDSQWVGFFKDSKLAKVSLNGGAPITLASAPLGRGGSWGENGYIVFAPAALGGLSRVQENGGKAEQITTRTGGSITHRWPQVVNRGELVLFTASPNTYDFNSAEIQAFSFSTRRTTTVLRGAYFARYFPTGHLLFFREGTLFAVPFDIEHAQTVGSAVPLMQDVYSTPQYGGGQFDFSSNGVFAYIQGRAKAGWPLAWFDEKGRSDLPMPPARYTSPALSPDGRLLAYVKPGGPQQQSDIWVYDLETKSPRPPHAESTPASIREMRVRFDGRNRGIGSWTPDGKHILYAALSGDRYSIEWIRATGGEQPWVLYDSSARLASPVISPDGRWLVFTAISPATEADIWAAPLDQSDPEHPKAGLAEAIIQTAAIENLGRISPDGNWLAYQSTESGGRAEIFVQRFTARNNTAAGKWQITTEGCAFPVWSRSGRRLYFAQLDEQAVMFVDYTSDGASFRPGQPHRLIEAPTTGAQPLPRVGDVAVPFDVAPDGRRVIVVTSDDDSGEAGRVPRAMLVLNWAEELRRRVPAGAR